MGAPFPVGVPMVSELFQQPCSMRGMLFLICTACLSADDLYVCTTTGLSMPMYGSLDVQPEDVALLYKGCPPQGKPPSGSVAVRVWVERCKQDTNCSTCGIGCQKATFLQLEGGTSSARTGDVLHFFRAVVATNVEQTLAWHIVEVNPRDVLVRGVTERVLELSGCLDQTLRDHICRQEIMVVWSMFPLLPHAMPNVRCCPACADGNAGEHGDACFKLKQRDRRSYRQVHPAFATEFMPGGISFDHGTLSLFQSRFHAFQEHRKKKGRGAARSPSGDLLGCAELRSMNAVKSGSAGCRVNALYASVCRHYVLDASTAVWIAGKGEPLIYAHYVLRYYLHLSGQLTDMPEVFGLPPDPPTRGKVGKWYVDVPCCLRPHLQKYDAAVLKHVELALGKVHGYAHKCLRKHSGRFMQQAAMTSGEAAETYWSFIQGVAPLAKHYNQEVFQEEYSYVICRRNEVSIERTPHFLLQNSEAAVEAFETASIKWDAWATVLQPGTVITQKLVDGWKATLFRDEDATKDTHDVSLEVQLAGATIAVEANEAVVQGQIALTQAGLPAPALAPATKLLQGAQARQVALFAATGVDRATYAPSVAQRKSWFICHAKMLQGRIDGLLSLHTLLGRRFQRGHNFQDSNNKDKSKVRRKQEDCKKKAATLKEQMSYLKQAGIALGATDADFASPLPRVAGHGPVDPQLECVEALEMMRRCKEELDTVLPRERTSYIRVCRERHHQLRANAQALETCARRDECCAATRRLLCANASVMQQGSSIQKHLAAVCDTVELCTSAGLTMPQ